MPFFEMSGLQSWCRSADQKLWEAFDGAHNRNTVTQRDRHLLHPSAVADRLLAVNARSRIAVGQHLCKEIADHLCVNEYWELDRPFFFLTLITSSGLVSKDEPRIDLASIKDLLRAHLRGHDYRGMLEPGYHASLPRTARV